MAINIEVVADVSKVIAGTNEMADSYDGVSDTLRDMSRDGDKAVNALERSLSNAGDAGRDAGREISQGMDTGADGAGTLERRARDAFDALSDNARTAGRDVSRSTRDGFDEASEGAETFRDNAGSNAKEVAASFDGSIESIADGFQGLAAEMLEGFGPAGLAAGVMVAAGLGMAITKAQGLAEANDEAAEAGASLGREIYEAGGALDSAAIADKLKEIAFSLAEKDVWYKWGDQAQTYVGLVREALDGLQGADTADVFKALAGDTEAAGRAQKYLADSMDESARELEKHLIGVNELGPVYSVEGDAIIANNKKRSELIEKIEKQSGVSKDAADDATYFAEVMGKEAEETMSATEALEAHAAALAESAGNALSLTDAENAYAETLGQMTADIANNGKSMDVNTEAGRANRESLVDLAQSANAVRDAQIAQGVSTDQVTAGAQAARDAFIAQAEAAGLDRVAAEALATSYGLIPSNVQTLVEAHGTDEAKAAVEGVGEPVTAPVDVTTEGTEAGAQSAVDSVQGTTAPVDVTTEGTDGAVQKRIDGIHGKPVKIDVDDEYTVKHVQNRIDGIRGKSVSVDVVPDWGRFDREMADRLRPRAVDVTVNERRGTQVNP